MQSAVIRGNFADWDTQLSHAISLCASISGQSYVTHSVTQILPPPMLLHTQKYGASSFLLGLDIILCLDIMEPEAFCLV